MQGAEADDKGRFLGDGKKDDSLRRAVYLRGRGRDGRRADDGPRLLGQLPGRAGRRRGGLRAGAEKIPGSRDRGGNRAEIRQRRGGRAHPRGARPTGSDCRRQRRNRRPGAFPPDRGYRGDLPPDFAAARGTAEHALPASHVPALLSPRDAQAPKRPRRAGSGGQRRAERGHRRAHRQGRRAGAIRVSQAA